MMARLRTKRSDSKFRGTASGWSVACMLACILAVVWLTSCGGSASAVVTADECLNDFLDEVFERNVSRSPVWESRLGRKTERQGQWDDSSDEFADSEIEQIERDLHRLRTEFDRAELSEVAQLSYDLFEYAGERRIRNHAFRDHFYVVDQFNGQLSGLLTVLLNNHPITTQVDAEAYVERLLGLRDVLFGMSERLRARADLGVIAPEFSFPAVIADASAMATGYPITEGAPNALWSDFTAKLDQLDADVIDDETKSALLERASFALAGPYTHGFKTLIEELQRIAPHAEGNRGVWALPRGEAFYENRIENHTSLALSADEVHATGISEVARIQDEMRQLQEQVGVPGTLQDFFEYVRTDPDNFYENSDAGRAQFLAEAQVQIDGIYEVVGDWFNDLPEAGLEVRRVEPWRENSVSIAFYNSPSQDGSRPGIYYANLADMEQFQKYVFTAITYHESVPGHHFQIARAQEMDGLPMFRRFGGGYGAYVEGWALYGEKLAKEMGFYKEPLHDFGRLQNELWRAARLVIDTGIHAKRWSREQAIDYFRDNTPLSDGDVVTEVERFFVNPGQALSYKIGMNKILELRDRVREQQGSDFDIRAFHDAVLGAGALPLNLLERRVEAVFAE